MFFQPMDAPIDYSKNSLRLNALQCHVDSSLVASQRKSLVEPLIGSEDPRLTPSLAIFHGVF